MRNENLQRIWTKHLATEEELANQETSLEGSIKKFGRTSRYMSVDMSKSHIDPSTFGKKKTSPRSGKQEPSVRFDTLDEMTIEEDPEDIEEVHQYDDFGDDCGESKVRVKVSGERKHNECHGCVTGSSRATTHTCLAKNRRVGGQLE